MNVRCSTSNFQSSIPTCQSFSLLTSSFRSSMPPRLKPWRACRLLGQTDAGGVVTTSELGQQILGGQLGMMHAHDDGARPPRAPRPAPLRDTSRARRPRRRMGSGS